MPESPKEWKCSHCGKCCLALPCIFAQVKYNITKASGVQCPDLFKKPDNTYNCLMMERNEFDIKKTMLNNECDDPAKAHLRTPTNIEEVLEQYFPGSSPEEKEHILWAHTSWPGFWKIPADGWTPVQCLHTQLKQHKEAIIRIKRREDE